jgi:NADP-dependent 3-hydroxy acid dehydrogenase YdfG
MVTTQSPNNSRIVVITGAGAGLGEAMARRFHRAGAQVIACDLLHDRVTALASDLGEGVDALAMDVTSSDDWKRVVQDTLHKYGQIDVLINNAGVAVAGRLEDTPIEDWHWVMDIDLNSVILGCQAVLPSMRARRSGHIINVASVAGLAGMPDINAYGTAKAGVVALSEMLRAEVHDAGIQVSALCPAFVQTRLTETMRASEDHFEERVKRWMERSGVSAQDVAEVVYQAVQKPRFLLLTHPQTKWMWRLKRWAPELYFRMVLRGAAKARQTKSKSPL